MGVLCLCQSPYKKFMWDKYASKDGICIGFSLDKIGTNSDSALPLKEDIKYGDSFLKAITLSSVKYGKYKYGAINRLPTDVFLHNVKKALLKKDKDLYKEEYEVRAFAYERITDTVMGEKGMVLHCNLKAIKEVIFSPSISEVRKKEVIKIIDSRSCGRSGISFYQLSQNYLDKQQIL